MFPALLEKSLLITLLTTLAALPSSAQTSDDLFDPQTLQSLHLRIRPGIVQDEVKEIR